VGGLGGRAEGRPEDQPATSAVRLNAADQHRQQEDGGEDVDRSGDRPQAAHLGTVEEDQQAAAGEDGQPLVDRQLLLPDGEQVEQPEPDQGRHRQQGDRVEPPQGPRQAAEGGARAATPSGFGLPRQAEIGCPRRAPPRVRRIPPRSPFRPSPARHRS